MPTNPALDLLPGWEGSEEEHEILKEFWPRLFETMLSAWTTKESLWPSERTHEMFKNWFAIETHAIIEDINEDEAIDYLQ